MRPSTAIVCSALAVLVGCTPAHLPGAGDDDDPGRCGDRTVDADETCDDGDTEPGDGCDADCQTDIPEGCGDDVLAGDEECDDGGNAIGDGCGRSCKIERCGNGVRDPAEACEDNNTVAADGCSADCRSDERCGNGIVELEETCDDGDDDDRDACPASCQPARCGDGFVHAGRESCDGGAGCTDCILDSCGNGDVDDGEECDLGAGNGSPGTACFASCIATELAMGEPIVTPIDPTLNLSSEPSSIEAGDFNGDGRIDVAVGDQGPNSVVVAYGFGDGRMWPPRFQFADTSQVDYVKLADVNGDDRLDAVVSATGLNAIEVFLGDPTGFAVGATFSTAIDIAGTSPRGLAIADLTGDGELDVVTANETSDDVTLMAGDGDGGFVALKVLGTRVGEAGDQPVDLAVADVTGDGIDDVVTANAGSDDVTVIPGLGEGEFAPPEIHSTRVGAGGDEPRNVVVADVSNDGRKDVITANLASDDVTVLAGLASGELAAPLRFVVLAGERGDAPRALAVGDVTGDGRRDIVTANQSDDVAVLAALGTGVAFAPVTHHSVRSEAAPDEAQLPTGVAIVDLDRDGRAEIVTTNESSSDLSVLVGAGGGALEPAVTYEVGSRDFISDSPQALAIGDVDRDGTHDAVVLMPAALQVVAGLGDGRLAPAQATFFQTRGHLAVGDLDGDGRLDVAVPTGSTITVGLQGPSGQLASVSSAASSAGLVAVALGEIDGDAVLEVAGADQLGSEVIVYDVSGDGFPNDPTSLTASGQPAHLTLADVTGDGELDLVVAVPGNDEVRIGAGNGAGDFASLAGLTTAVSSSGQAPSFVVVDDVDGDGKADVCTANLESNDVTVLLGEGSGTFADPRIVPAVFGGEPAEVSAVRSGDLDGDGVRDLVTANAARGTISVLIGFGDGGFAAPQSFEVGAVPRSLAVADADGDGIDDVIAVTQTDRTVVVLLSEGHP